MKTLKLILMIFVGIGISASGFSQTEAFFIGTTSGVGGRALSMGGAYSAVADDYSATLWNPAGLTQLRRMELFVSLSNFKYSNDASYLGLSKTDNTTKTKFNSIGFAFPIPTYRGSMVLAVGYNRVREFDGGFSIESFFDAGTDTAHHRKYTEVESGGMTNWVLSGATEVTHNLSVGAALNIWRGKDDYNWIREFDSNLNIYYYDFDNNQNIVTDYRAVNFKLGALYKLGFLGRVAASIETPINFDASEKWREETEYFDNYNPEYADSVFYDADEATWDYSIKFPFTFKVGAALTLLPNIVVTGDVEYTDWSQTRYTSEPPEGEKYEQNEKFRQGFRPTTTYRVGGEFTVPLISTQLRAGLIYQPTPFMVENEVNGITVYDDPPTTEDRKFVTVGAGFLLDKQVKLDVAYVHGWWNNRQDNVFDRFNVVDEKITTNKLFASMSIRF